MVDHVRAMLGLLDRGSTVFDYGNNLRQRAYEAGEARAFAFPGFVPAYIRPEFCLGRGPFRWAALSGLPEDIYTIDEALLELFPDDQSLSHWLGLARDTLDPDALVEEAARLTGLSDLGDPSHRPALEALLRSCEVDANLHFIGRRHMRDLVVRALVTRLTDRHEQPRSEPWAVSDAPDDYVTKNLRPIVGVELEVEGVEAKAKLSQNRSDEDRAGVARGLEADGRDPRDLVAE